MINGTIPGPVPFPGRQQTGFDSSLHASIAGKGSENKSFMSLLEEGIGKGTKESGVQLLKQPDSEGEKKEQIKLVEFLREVVLSDGDDLFKDFSDGEWLTGIFPEEIAADIVNKLKEAVENNEMLDPDRILEDPEFIIAFLSFMPQAEAEYGPDHMQAYKQALPVFINALNKLFPGLSPLTGRNINTWEELSRQVMEISKEPPADKQKAAGLRGWTEVLASKTKPTVDTYGNLLLPQTGQEVKNLIQIDPASSHLSRLQQFFLHTGPQPSERVTEEQFLRQFQSILKGGVFRGTDSGIQQLTVKLYPQHLGRLDITIQQINGVLTAKLAVATSQARELIEGQLHQLRQAFHGQQLPVERVEVTQQQTHQQALKDSREQTGEEGRGQHPSPEEDRGKEEDEESFAVFLEETINMKV